MQEIKEVLSLLSDRLPVNKSSDTKIFTPYNIANDMIDVIPDEFWTKNIKILDICCKSGIFLHKAYEKLMNSLDLIKSFPNEVNRREYIFNNQLYGICPDQTCWLLSMRMTYGQMVMNSNLIYLDNYTSIINNTDKLFIYEILKKEFETVNFNIVITNPPYNRGMDLDFVDLAYKLSTDYTVAITPAKWQTAAPDQRIASKISYGEFRAKYVPHMSQVVFYPDCGNVFKISQVDGITWYVMDKEIHEKCKVINKCNNQKHYNSVAIRNIREREREFIKCWRRNCA